MDRQYRFLLQQKKLYEYYTRSYQTFLVHAQECNSQMRQVEQELQPAVIPIEQHIISKNEKPSTVHRNRFLRQSRHIKNQKMYWPLERSSFWLSSKFGPRKKENGILGYHYGIDMAAAKGTPVMAASAGIVIEASYSNKGYGKTILIAHDDGIFHTRYAHLDEILVKVGQKVKPGLRIGSVGNTGAVRGENGGRNAYHLHFEVKKRGSHIDPLSILT
ncbi:MAG: M23 family metallopeptidase [Candidatus Babeliales bacterium]